MLPRSSSFLTAELVGEEDITEIRIAFDDAQPQITDSGRQHSHYLYSYIDAVVVDRERNLHVPMDVTPGQLEPVTCEGVVLQSGPGQFRPSFP